jgi:hypothetical protein
MWWHFRFLFGQTYFSFGQDSFSKLPDRMSDKLSWISDMSGFIVVNAFFNNISIRFSGTAL